jgi:hypothetical protein
MVACLAQWRESIVGCGDVGLREQVREIESVSRMVHSVMLAAVAELDSRRVAATSGFGTTKRLLAGMLRLSATEAGTRVAHAAQLAPRRALGGEALAPHPRAPRPGRSRSPRGARIRSRRRGAPVPQPPRWPARPRGIPRTRAQRRVPLSHRTPRPTQPPRAFPIHAPPPNATPTPCWRPAGSPAPPGIAPPPPGNPHA